MTKYLSEKILCYLQYTVLSVSQTFHLSDQIFPTRYLRCPSAVTVSVLKKFLVTKFAIPSTHQVKHSYAPYWLSDLQTDGPIDRLTD